MQGLTVWREGALPVRVDIIFIHGLRGDSLNTWSDGKTCWPRDFLAMDLPNARIMTWGYDSSVVKALEFSSQNSLLGHAENLLTDVSNRRRGEDEKTRPILFVGHSMGGLVVKQALIRSNAMLLNKQDLRRGAIFQYTGGIMFMGTPHRGSDKESQAEIIAKLAGLAYRRPNKQLLETLAVNSDILQSQRASFDSICKDLSIVCLYEEKPTAIGLIVPESSACLDGFHIKRNSLPANHMDMARFGDRNSVAYQRTLGYILDLVEDIDLSLQSVQSFSLEDRQNQRMTNIRSNKDRTTSVDPNIKVLESLRFDTMDDRFFGVAPESELTFRWLYENQDLGYSEWLRNGKDIFWINGKAGSGKSTLMKYAFSNPLTRQLLDDGSTEANKPFLAHFFFHGRGNQMQKSLEGLLRTILYEILFYYPKSISRVLGTQPRRNWNMDSLNTTFRKLFTQKGESELNICLFLDGLDEFNGDHTKIAEFLFETVQRSVYPFRICLSSRPLPVFKHQFRSCPQIQLHSQTNSDIYSFVTKELMVTNQMQILARQSLWSTNRFVEQVVDRASGVFLWARLATKSLVEGLAEGESLQELDVRLNQLPQELDELFQVMLGNIKTEQLREAAQMFQILMVAISPYSLIDFSFACDDPSEALRSVSSMSEDQARNRENIFALRVQSRCAGLIEITKEYFNPKRHAVQFIHQSVKDFIKQPGNWTIITTENDVNFDPARSLLAASVQSFKSLSLNSARTGISLEKLQYYGALAEQSTQNHQADLLEEFDRVSTERYNIETANITHASNDSTRAIPHRSQHIINEHPGWINKSICEWGAATTESSLVALAVWLGMPLYVKHVLDQDSISQISKDRLLQLRVHNMYQEIEWEGRFITAVLLELLQGGADPNAINPFSRETTWQYSLTRWFFHFCERSYYSQHKDEVCVESLELFIRYGADIHVMVHLDGTFVLEGQNKEVAGKIMDMSLLSVLKRLVKLKDNPRLKVLIYDLEMMGAVEVVHLSPAPALSRQNMTSASGVVSPWMIDFQYGGSCQTQKVGTDRLYSDKQNSSVNSPQKQYWINYKQDVVVQPRPISEATESRQPTKKNWLKPRKWLKSHGEQQHISPSFRKLPERVVYYELEGDTHHLQRGNE